ncbi:MAG: hypothetical protein Q9227_003724 [Pyrenula ochraceoflavens]
METAIRWSQNSVPSNERFLQVDVAGRSLKLCKVDRRKRNDVTYHTVFEATKVPAFRAFDWSPVDEALVAVGQSSGEVTVLRIDDSTAQETLSLPVRNQRYCNAVAFSNNGLLASGLDKVRNDSCLNLWDLNQRSIAVGALSPGSDRSNVEPYIRLANSEPITSIKFFPGQPQLLVAGIEKRYVRIYDLREPSGNAPLQFATRCVHNIAIDSKNEDFFASCAPGNDATICIWDKRSGGRDSSSSLTGHGDLTQPALELKKVTDAQGAIWSLRYAKTKRGNLGVMTNTGHLKTYDTVHAPAAESEPEGLEVCRVRDVHKPYYHQTQGRDEERRVVSFDFLTHGSRSHKLDIITLSRNGNIETISLPDPPGPALFTSHNEFIRSRTRENGLWKLEVTQPSSTLHRDTAKTLLAMQPKLKQYSRNDKRSPAGETQTSPPKLSVEVSQNDLQPPIFVEKDLNNEQNLTMGQLLGLASIQHKRCTDGYRLTPSMNQTLTQDCPKLPALWSWVANAQNLSEAGSMTYNHLDLSYLGVYDIWMDDVGAALVKKRRVGGSASGSPPVSKAVEGISRQHGVNNAKLCATNWPANRRLCLRLCDIYPIDSNLDDAITHLLEARRATEAAFILLLFSSPKRAIDALRDVKVAGSSTQTNRMLAMAIAGISRRQRKKRSQQTSSSREFSESSDSDSDSDSWSSTIESLKSGTNDPFALAILSYTLSGSWANVIDQEILPLRYRIGAALCWLPDHELTDLISHCKQLAIDQGDIEGIALTGCSTASAIDLMENYVRHTGDLQTAVLTLAFGVPRYVDENKALRKFDAWKETYRQTIQSWDLKFERVRFDIECAKLAGSEATKPQKQLSLVCGYCSQSIAHHSPNDSLLGGTDQTIEGQTRHHRTQRHPLTPEKAAAIGTVCPKCGRHLPRCGVCDMWLGMSDPTYLRNHGGDRSAGNADPAEDGTATAEEGKIVKESHTLDLETQYKEQKERERKLAELLSNFITFCIHCNHGFHAMHALQWFGSQSGFGGLASQLFPGSEWQWRKEGRRICPVADCGCICDRA